MPSALAHSASSLVVTTWSMSRISGMPRWRPAAFISSRRISAFLAVQGVTATFTMRLGSSPRALAKYVLIVGPCMPIGLFADEMCGRISGWNVSHQRTQAGQQLVNCGSGAVFFVTRSMSSLASSMIVRSAAKFVSSTKSAPSLRSSATILPSTKLPSGRPKASPSAARTEGDVEKITIFSGSAMQSFTAAHSLRMRIESTGQTAAH